VFQRASAPPELQYKIETAFDGVDTETFRPREVPRPARIGGVELPPGVKVVTYVSPGLESIRGFDVFMQVAKRVCRARDDVVFLVAGEGRTVYGHETDHLQGRSFKDHVLASDEFPLDRIRFLGRIPLEELARLFNLADAHVYLTVPFTLSWSLVQAMASGCVVVGSATAPVEEVIDDGVHGLLAEFHDADGLARRVLAVLDDPAARGRLGAAASARVAQRYSREVCFERLARLFDADAAGGSAGR
jgi:glycosyltransferase involved in cell wall biosynthesis